MYTCFYCDTELIFDYLQIEWICPECKEIGRNYE
jgi:rubredoxin